MVASSQQYSRKHVVVHHEASSNVQAEILKELAADTGKFLLESNLDLYGPGKPGMIIKIWLTDPIRSEPDPKRDVGFDINDIRYLRHFISNFERYQNEAPLYAVNPPSKFNLLSLVALKISLKSQYQVSGKGFYQFLCDIADEILSISDNEWDRLQDQGIKWNSRYFQI